MNFHYFVHVCEVRLPHSIISADLLSVQTSYQQQKDSLHEIKTSYPSSILLRNSIPTSLLPENLKNLNFNILALLNMYGNNLHEMFNVSIVHKKSRKESVFVKMALLC